jgi:hypothetical protein
MDNLTKSVHITLGKLAYILSILLVAVICCSAIGYYYSTDGLLYVVGNIFVMLLIIFSIHLISFILYMTTFTTCSYKFPINAFFMLWFFIYSLYFMFMGYVFLCDFTLAAFFVMISIQIVLAACFVTMKRKDIKKRIDIMPSVLVFFYGTCFAQLLFFIIMYGNSSPYRKTVSLINTNENLTLNTTFVIPTNCINPRISIFPEMSHEDYSYELDLYSLFFQNATHIEKNILNMHFIDLTCGMTIIQSNYTLGAIAITNSINSTHTQVIEYFDGFEPFVLLLVPFVFMFLLFASYAVITADHAKSEKIPYRSFELQSLMPSHVIQSEVDAYSQSTMERIAALDPNFNL